MLRFHGSEKPSGAELFGLIHKRKWDEVFKMLDKHPELAVMGEVFSVIAPPNSIVDCALFQGNIQIVNRLRAYPGAYKHPNPDTIAYLIQQKNWNAILHLIEYGWMNANYIMPYGHSYRSILDWANEDREFVNRRLLIERHKAKTYQVLSDDAVLFRAAEYDDWQSVFALLDKGSFFVNARNIHHPHGWTLLNYAYFHEQPDVFLFLINEHKADLAVALDAAAGIQALLSFQWNAMQANEKEKKLGTVISATTTPSVNSEIPHDPDAQKKHLAKLKKTASSTVPIAETVTTMDTNSLIEQLGALQLEPEENVSRWVVPEAEDNHLIFSQLAQQSKPEESFGIKALHRDYPPPEGGDPIVAFKNKKN
ncbi:MAG: hypothetical protein AB7D28_06370 [Candidatus Berkiella sp.]